MEPQHELHAQRHLLGELTILTDAMRFERKRDGKCCPFKITFTMRAGY